MDELLPYYNRELAYIRKLGAEFADKHPKIASRLRISSGTVRNHRCRLYDKLDITTERELFFLFLNELFAGDQPDIVPRKALARA